MAALASGLRLSFRINFLNLKPKSLNAKPVNMYLEVKLRLRNFAPGLDLQSV